MISVQTIEEILELRDYMRRIEKYLIKKYDMRRRTNSRNPRSKSKWYPNIGDPLNPNSGRRTRRKSKRSGRKSND